MPLQVIGAGLGRTGTLSLKLALERLLGGHCYHMIDVFGHPEHIPTWHSAARGTMPDWETLFAGCCAAVDEPPAAYWRELVAAYPDALVVLSVRDPQSWWESADRTTFAFLRDPAPPAPPFMSDWHAMVNAMMDARFPGMRDDRETAITLFERHNADVRAAIPADRLLAWEASEGWGPVCAALDVPVPDEPFPHANTRTEWLARAGRE